MAHLFWSCSFFPFILGFIKGVIHLFIWFFCELYALDHSSGIKNAFKKKSDQMSFLPANQTQICQEGTVTGQPDKNCKQSR